MLQQFGQWVGASLESSWIRESRVRTSQPEQTNQRENSRERKRSDSNVRIPKRMSVPELDVNVPESNRYS